MDREAEIKPAWFTQLISYYQRRNQPEEALRTLRQAVETVPDHAPFHVWLGDHYLKEGITYRAREEYERAVILDPGNEEYLKNIRKIGDRF